MPWITAGDSIPQVRAKFLARAAEEQTGLAGKAVSLLVAGAYCRLTEGYESAPEVPLRLFSTVVQA